MHAAIVDSSRVVLKLIAQFFNERGDKASTFVDSRTALQHILDDPTVDVLITSLEVEPINGLELCWETRLAAGSRRPLYIVVMSSVNDQDKIIEALDCGADDMISKPISRQQLNARLRMAARLQSTQLHLVRLAETDPLTGLLNRRAFFEHLSKILNTQVPIPPLSAIMFDIDHFKRVNDGHGHHAGDQVIAAVAKEAAKLKGIAARLGGEEFVVVVEGYSEDEVYETAEHLRMRCADLVFNSDDGSFSITCSLGITSWAPGDSADDLLRRADMALYEAKACGRNCVKVASAIEGEGPRSFQPKTRKLRKIVQPQ